MYIEIKENKIVGWCEKPYKDFVEFDADCSTFSPDKYEIKEGAIVDISDSDEYKNKVAEKEKQLKLESLKAQIEDLDKKRIRAIAEPELKDAQNGITWLEFYTKEIKSLRDEISNL